MSEEEGNRPEFVSSGTPERTRRHRARGITPEQRRLLDTPRESSAHSAESAQAEADQATYAGPNKTSTPSPPAESRPTHKSRLVDPGDFGRVTAPAHVTAHGSRTIEARQAFLILGTILLLGLSFYGGTKLNYVKYLLASRNAPRLAKSADRVTGVAAEDLVKQALTAERAGEWQEAVDRFSGKE